MSKFKLISLLTLGLATPLLAFDEDSKEPDAFYMELGDPATEPGSTRISESTDWKTRIYNLGASAWHYTLSSEAPYYQKIKNYLKEHPRLRSTCDSLSQVTIAAILFQTFIKLDLKRYNGEKISEETDVLIDRLYEVASFSYDNSAKSINRYCHDLIPRLSHANRILLLTALYPLMVYIDLHLLIQPFGINIGLTHIAGLMTIREVMDIWTELSREKTIHGETIDDLEAQIAAEITRRNIDEII